MAINATNIITIVKNIYHPVAADINVGRAKTVTATAAIINAIGFPIFANIFSPYPIHLPDFLSYHLSRFPIPMI